jgi:hypothetical protein
LGRIPVPDPLPLENSLVARCHPARMNPLNLLVSALLLPRWGDGTNGQLGNGGEVGKLTPVAVAAP